MHCEISSDAFRSLPKRLCAITLSQDEQTILLADKFGDVYSLPLHPSSEYQSRTASSQPSNVFKPSASKLTVHTKGNLEALRQQERQKEQQAKKEGPDFEHKLLLGHVSLLTDLIVAEGQVNGRKRPFIITSDRDEHIRVSRGIPQTHIIEKYCSGHRDFISKLCVLPWQPDLLVAGNGEPSLRIYRWQDGMLVNTIHLSELLQGELEAVLAGPGRSMERLAVSGIWPTKLAELPELLLCALEGLPALLTFVVDDADLSLVDVLQLSGNLLDLVSIPGQACIAIAIDDVHEPGSMKVLREELTSSSCSIKIFKLSQNAISILSQRGTENPGEILSPSDLWEDMQVEFEVEAVQRESSTVSRDVNDTEVKDKNQGRLSGQLGEFLYGLENLRKKRGQAAVEEDEATEVVDEQI